MLPIIFQTKYFTLYTFWIFFAIAVIAFGIIIVKLSIKNNLKLQFLSEHSWKLFLLSFIGSRIFAIIENYQTYFFEFSIDSFLQLFYFWDKGLNIWGAIITFLITLYFLTKKHKRNFWRWMDVLIPSFIIAIAIGSIGAFFDGINYGHETSLPWGVNFESPSIKYTVPIHPTQIYSFIYSIIIAISLIMIGRHYKSKIKEKDLEGIIGFSGIIAFNFFYFLEQFTRGDDSWMIFNIRLGLILSLIITITTSIFLILRYNKPIKKQVSKSEEK